MNPVTYADVCQAIDSLLNQHQSITLANIRQALGNRGSMSTLSKYLQTWKQEKFFSDRDPAPVTAPAPDPIFSAVQSVWQQMQGIGYQQVQEKEEEMARMKIEQDQEREAHQIALEHHKNQYLSTLKELQEALRKNQHLEKQYDDIVEEYRELSDELKKALQKSQEFSEKLHLLHQDHQKTQEHSLQQLQSYQNEFLQKLHQNEERARLELQHLQNKYTDLLAQYQHLQALHAEVQKTLQIQKETQTLLHDIETKWEDQSKKSANLIKSYLEEYSHQIHQSLELQKKSYSQYNITWSFEGF